MRRWAVCGVVAWCLGAGAADFHSADTSQDGVVSLSELLRVIQFYNVGALHCAEGTEDGFAPGPGPQDCTPHASDYLPRNWAISLSELLRVIQFYNSGQYHCCAETPSEDGYCPGPGAGVCPGGGAEGEFDTIPPVIALAGPLTVTLPCGEDYVEPGASAVDETDGDLTQQVVVDLSGVSPLTPGIHTVEYTVSDAAGNTATRTRRVISLCDTPVAFGDPALEAAVRAEIGKPVDPLLPADLADPAFTQLAASTVGIASLDGLEYCAHLVNLDLHGNCIADLAPLAHLDQLVQLNLHDNAIADVAPLRHLGMLHLLWLGRNQITSVAPLVENAGIEGTTTPAAPDRVNLVFNPLPPEAEDALDVLDARGVYLWRPAATPLPDKGVSETGSVRVTLRTLFDRVTLVDVATFARPTPAPKLGGWEGARLVVRDTRGGETVAPVRFPLEVSSCGLDAPDGDSVGDFEVRDTATVSITLPVAGAVEYIAYHRWPGDDPTVLLNGAPKGVDPCEPADAPGDPIPISATLVHGDPNLPDERAYVIVVMGDAFPLDELGDPRAPLAPSNVHYIPFANAIGDSMHYILGSEPFDVFAPWMKIYRVDLISVDNRPTDLRTEPITERDTALRMERKTVGFNYDQALAARVASNTGIAWDKIVLLPNGDGSGTQTADFIVYSNFSPSRKLTGLHEFGHGVGGLSDEYEYRHGTNPPTSYEPANVDAPNAISRNLRVPFFDEIPWRHWLADAGADFCLPTHLGEDVDFNCLDDNQTTCQCAPAPEDELDCVAVPTCEPGGDFVAENGKLYGRAAWPEPGAFPSVVGLFEGSKYRRKGAYRPELRCRMRSDDDVEPGQTRTPLFCRVCRETLITQIFQYAGNVARAVPDPGVGVEFEGNEGAEFSVVLHGPAPEAHTPTVLRWELDGVPIPGAQGLTYSLDADQLTPGNDHILSVVVGNPTPWIHPAFEPGQAAANQTVEWTVTRLP